MPWKKIEFSKREWERIDSELSEFKRKARFLVDENVTEDLTSVLRERGYNVRAVEDFGLSGRDDTEVFDLAKREDRILITQDKDFLSDRHFPLQGSPGIAVLPCQGNEDAFVKAFGHLLTVHGDSHDLWREERVLMPGDDTVSVRCRDSATGKWQTIRFKFPEKGVPMVWEDE